MARRRRTKSPNKLGALIDILPDSIKWMLRAVLWLLHWCYSCCDGFRSPLGYDDNETTISSRNPMPPGRSEKISSTMKFPGIISFESPRRASIDSNDSGLRPQRMHTASVYEERRSSASRPPAGIRRRLSYSPDRPYIDSPILESGLGRSERRDPM